MGLAIDTVAFTATNPGAGGAAAATVSGDSSTVRNFGAASKAYMDFLTRQGASSGFVSVRSPLFHDVARGLQYFVSETPAVQLMPAETGQPVRPSDNLQLLLSGGGAEVDGGAFGIYYQDLPGTSAVLKNWEEIVPAVKNIKPTQVQCTTAATSGVWADTAITTTESILKADTYYALLGYEVDAAVMVCAVRGPETGNLRVGGPGTTSSFRTGNYFVDQGKRHLRPYILVFNANNRNNITVGLSAIATGATVNVMLTLAELDTSLFHS